MKRSHFSTLRKGFSLVELLVVIAIIAVLAGISYPVITGSIAKAKIAEGAKMASDLVFAIEQFEQKYDYLPYPNGGTPDGIQTYTTDDAELLLVLMGMDDELNPSNTKFFEADAAKNKINGIVFSSDGETPEALHDPFGNPFTVVIDYTGERKIDFAEVPTFAAYVDKDEKPLVIHSTTAVVASPGPDKEYNDIKDVKTW